MIRYQVKISQDEEGYIAFFPDFLEYYAGREDQCYAFGDDFRDVIVSAEVLLKVIFEFALQDRKLDHLPEPQRREGNDYYWIALDAQMAYPIFIRKARMGADMSREALAQKAKIPLQDLINLETYGQSNMSISTLQRIARAIHAQLDIRFIHQEERL